MNVYRSRDGGWFDETDLDRMNMLDACFRGDIEEVRSQLNSGKVDVNEADTDGTTALHIAAAKGHRNLVEFLLEKGAEIEKANFAGMTAFLHACREGHIDVVTFLCNRNANIHQTTFLGVSAMTLACAGGHIEVARTLKMLSVDINPKPSRSNREYSIAPSPLMVACCNMDIEICSFLMQNGADKKFRVDHLKLGVEEMIERSGIDHMLRILRTPDESAHEIFKNHIEKRDIKRVIESGDERELLQMLLQNGRSSASMVQRDGVTPLMYATVMGRLNLAELILNNSSCNIDAQENVLGVTALMFAIATENDAMVSLLLEKGARVTVQSTTKEPFTALDLVLYAKFENPDIMRKIVARSLAANGTQIAGLDSGGGSRSGSALSFSSSSGSGGWKRTTNKPRKFLKRMIEEIGVNLGVADPRQRGHFGGEPLLRFDSLVTLMSSGIRQQHQGGNQKFVLAEQILRSEARVPRTQKSSAEICIETARCVILNWMQFGDTLPAKVFSGLCRSHPSPTISKLPPSNGIYSNAQRNAQEMLKNLQHHNNPKKLSLSSVKTRKSSSEVLLPHLATLNSIFHQPVISIPKQQHLLKTPQSAVQRRAPHRQQQQQQQNQTPHQYHYQHQASPSESSLNGTAVHQRIGSSSSLKSGGVVPMAATNNGYNNGQPKPQQYQHQNPQTSVSGTAVSGTHFPGISGASRSAAGASKPSAQMLFTVAGSETETPPSVGSVLNPSEHCPAVRPSQLKRRLQGLQQYGGSQGSASSNSSIWRFEQCP